jgi:tungstate transport system substrate-binding protein
MKKPVVFLCCLVVLAQYGPALAEPRFRQMVIATGSPLELGLVPELGTAFGKQHHCTVRYIKTPTGPGLELARHGLAHITMGHNRKATEEFVREGYAARRANLMHNFTIIIGPKDDPAKIAGLSDLNENIV